MVVSLLLVILMTFACTRAEGVVISVDNSHLQGEGDEKPHVLLIFISIHPLSFSEGMSGGSV